MGQNPSPTMVSGNCGGNAPANTIGGEGNFFFDEYNGNVWGPKTRGVWPAPPTTPGYPFRTQITTNRTYYISTTGSDSNDGLSSATAFATFSHALDIIFALDFSIYTITLQIEDGTYTVSSDIVIAGKPPGLGSSAQFIIQGNVASPSNVVLQSDGVTADVTVLRFNGAFATISGMKLISAGPATVNDNARCVAADYASFVTIGPGVEVGAATSAQFALNGQSSLDIKNGMTVSGSSKHWLFLRGSSYVYNWWGVTHTFSGALTFSSSTVEVEEDCVMYEFAFYTITVSVTGVKFNVILNGIIQSFGGGGASIPGSIAGTTATQGQVI